MKNMAAVLFRRNLEGAGSVCDGDHAAIVKVSEKNWEKMCLNMDDTVGARKITFRALFVLK